MKKVCDEVSKVKMIKQICFSFFHAGRHGRLVFYPNRLYVGPIWLLKWSILAFSEKLKSLKLIFKNPWVKNQKIQILLHTICRLVQDNHFCHSKSRLILRSLLIRKLIHFRNCIEKKFLGAKLLSWTNLQIVCSRIWIFGFFTHGFLKISLRDFNFSEKANIDHFRSQIGPT